MFFRADIPGCAPNAGAGVGAAPNPPNAGAGAMSNEQTKS